MQRQVYSMIGINWKHDYINDYSIHIIYWQLEYHVHERDSEPARGLSPGVLQGCDNLGISLGTISQYLTTRSRTQNAVLAISPAI